MKLNVTKTRAELSVLFYKGYKSLPRIFHLRTNISETVKILLWKQSM